jgi:nitrate/nitrite transporter NarK
MAGVGQRQFSDEQSGVERSTIKKIATRLVPFVALMFFINFLDRTAIAFAGPNGMNEDLGLSAAQFGFASGVFFIGYILLEIPSNIALHKFGARRWLSRIVVSWGIVVVLSRFCRVPHNFIGLGSRLVWPKQDSSPALSFF